MFKQRCILFFILFLFFLPVSEWGVRPLQAEKQDETPTGLLKAIRQRNDELDKRARELSLKEQRLRILEQEITEKLKKITQLRDEAKQKEDSEKALAAQRAEEDRALIEKKAALERAIAIARAETEDRVKKETAKRAADKMKKMEEEKAEAVAEKENQAEEKTAASRKRKKGSDIDLDDPSSKSSKRTVDKVEAHGGTDLEGDLDDPELMKKEADRKSLQDTRFANLAKVYEIMPPEEAALRLQNMKQAYAMEIIPRMKAKKAARVLAMMDPVMAAKYSEKMGSP
jgi:hypothetical protein